MASYFEPSSPVNPISVGTAQVPQVWPSLANPINTAGAPNGAYGLSAWVQIVAAGNIGAAMLIGVYVQDNGGGSFEYQLEIGQGGAGLETVVWRVHSGLVNNSTVGNYGGKHFLIVPGTQLATNARLSVRIASNAPGANVTVALQTLPTPA